jgi:hypothetical protein
LFDQATCYSISWLHLVLENILDRSNLNNLRNRFRLAVIDGDIATSRTPSPQLSVRSSQINTGSYLMLSRSRRPLLDLESIDL